jgi:hypothetical protein
MQRKKSELCIPGQTENKIISKKYYCVSKMKKSTKHMNTTTRIFTLEINMMGRKVKKNK